MLEAGADYNFAQIGVIIIITRAETKKPNFFNFFMRNLVYFGTEPDIRRRITSLSGLRSTFQNVNISLTVTASAKMFGVICRF